MQILQLCCYSHLESTAKKESMYLKVRIKVENRHILQLSEMNFLIKHLLCLELSAGGAFSPSCSVHVFGLFECKQKDLEEELGIMTLTFFALISQV